MRAVPCPANDGTCAVPDAPGGRALIARAGVLVAVPRASFEKAFEDRSEGARDWQQVEVAAMAAAMAEGDDDEAQIAVFTTDGGHEVSGFYVVCQPCGHKWVDER